MHYDLSFFSHWLRTSASKRTVIHQSTRLVPTVQTSPLKRPATTSKLKTSPSKETLRKRSWNQYLNPSTIYSPAKPVFSLIYVQVCRGKSFPPPLISTWPKMSFSRVLWSLVDSIAPQTCNTWRVKCLIHSYLHKHLWIFASFVQILLSQRGSPLFPLVASAPKICTNIFTKPFRLCMLQFYSIIFWK